MMLTILPIVPVAALAIADWRYDPPYDYYNSGDDPLTFAAMCSAEQGYFQILEDDALVGFCCFGEDAQVPGGDYTAAGLDVGIGMRPDLTGRGLGSHYLAAVLAFAAQRFAPPALRLTVATWNTRALRLYRKSGFRVTQEFRSRFSDQAFLLLRRECPPGPVAPAPYRH